MNDLRRFAVALGTGLLWGSISATTGFGFYTFLWMLMPPARLGQAEPFANIPVLDAILLIAMPIATFLIIGGIGFLDSWEKHRPDLNPRHCV
jgi:hypothetical protein